jgi:RNA polymerase sigma-32 factor
MTTDVMSLSNLAPGQDIDSYLQTISYFPILDAEEEKILAERFVLEGDIEAARSLVVAHLRFVVHLARSYRGYGMNEADLIQEGNVGLMKAVKRFDPSVGVRLISFAVHWIKAEIHEYILKNFRIVKVATTKAQRKLFFNLRSAKKSLNWLTADESKAIAEDLGVPVAEVVKMESRLTASDAGYDGYDSDEENVPLSPSQYLTSDVEDPADSVLRSSEERDNRRRLELAISDLDLRSREILQKRWLSEEKATLHELASNYGVSAERIRQIEKNAMTKIKNHMQQ